MCGGGASNEASKEAREAGKGASAGKMRCGDIYYLRALQSLTIYSPNTIAVVVVFGMGVVGVCVCVFSWWGDLATRGLSASILRVCQHAF